MAFRRITRESYRMCTYKMANAITENRTRDLWCGVRRIKVRNKFLPCSVNFFSYKYNHLYNSVSYDIDEMNSTGD